MAIKDQTKLLLVFLLLLIAVGALSIGHQVSMLSHLEREYSYTEKQISSMMKECETLTLEQWMLLNLGTYPRNATSLNLSEDIEALIFYSYDILEEDLDLRFDQLTESYNLTVTYLGFANQTNLNLLKDICDKTGFPEPNQRQNYLIVLNPSKIICLRVEQVDSEVLSKCIEYLSLSVSET